MSRRNKPDKQEILPDVRYSSVHVQSFINRVSRIEAMSFCEPRSCRLQLSS